MNNVKKAQNVLNFISSILLDKLLKNLWIWISLFMLLLNYAFVKLDNCVNLDNII